MSYLHSHDILHCNLNSKCIFLDKSFYPKIGCFDFSYHISEVLLKGQYSKSSGVYSFSIVAYEILTREKPFQKLNTTFDIINEVAILRKRPSITHAISNFYEDLIKRCWSHDPTERPSFDEIVDLLKSNPELIDDEEYQNYIKFIEKSQKSFDQAKQFHQLDEIYDKKMSSQKVETFVSNGQFDMKKFTKGNIIDNILFNDIYLIKNNKTDEEYSARISDIDFCKFSHYGYIY